jgi:peptide/nickel transport system ATP-binding protein
MTELLRADHLTKHFKIGSAVTRDTLHAVDDVSFSIGEREIVALAGESGSGKSTVARLLARVYPPTRGTVTYYGDDSAGKSLAAIRSRRDALRYSSQVPMVFQDPFSSINPVFRVSHGVLRALKLHRPELSARERRAEAERVFDVVGLGTDMLGRYPHELSGGQRQRVGFAQALATKPRLILADEPVSMLDVSIRIGLLNLMAKLRDEEDVSVLYITHDIASARYVANRLIVMYAGQVAEAGPIEDVLAAPKHPYTQLLVSAVPDPKAPPPSLEALAAAAGEHGEPPKVINPSPGCRFQPRCPVSVAECATRTPTLLPLGLPSEQQQTRNRDGSSDSERVIEVACHVAQSGAEVVAFS